MKLKTISLLGSGWLGLPLAEHFILKGFDVKASTTSAGRLAELRSIGAQSFIVDLEKQPDNIQSFLKAHILIINITSKSIPGFAQLIRAIERSDIEKVLFVSSTSVYDDLNTTISEADGLESPTSPLVVIEKLFSASNKFKTTIVRFAGLIGYSRHPGRFFRSGRIVQNPDSPVNLIHRDDCVEIIARIIDREIWGEALNCCADTHPSKREFYTHAARSLGEPPPEFATSTGPFYKIISNEKVKHLLAYDFLHPDLMRIQF